MMAWVKRERDRMQDPFFKYLLEHNECEEGSPECFEGTRLSDLTTCPKNNHHNYIPIPEFSCNKHLPDAWWSPLVYDWTQSVADVTTLLKVDYVSASRPEGYPFWDKRGTTTCLNGTGCIRSILHHEDTKCECLHCRQSCNPFMEWWEMRIATAAHVIFDVSEARNTRVVLYFDDPHDISNTVVLRGNKVLHANIDRDWCNFTCITHDETVAENIEHQVEHVRETSKKVRLLYKQNVDNAKLPAIVVSHPHGCSKHVSIGDYLGLGPYRGAGPLLYTAATCPGSSGAGILAELSYWDIHLWVYGERGYTHSSGSNGINRSSNWNTEI